MHLRRNEQLERECLDGIRESVQARNPTRTPGPHLTDVIVDIALQMQLLRRGNPEQRDYELERYATMGFVWEDIIGKHLASLHGIQPGQFECHLDGIIGTPDRFRPGTGEVDEFKATWMSTKHDITGEKFWRWWSQIKGYCRMLNTHWANLYVFFVNNDYRPPRPELIVYSAMFEDSDIIPNWRLITEHRDKMVRERGEWWLGASQ